MKFNAYITISIIILIIIVILIKIYRWNKALITTIKRNNDRLINNIGKMNVQSKEDKKVIELINISNDNLKNAITYEPLKDGKRHIDICTLDDGQQIVLIFDEEWTYIIEYFQQKPLSEKKPYIKTIELHCTAFIDGKIFDPILLNPIYKCDNRAVINPIDCGKYKGRGLGTCVIQSLIKVLKELGVKELKASLSTVDYDVKDKLYNFYISKNGFKLIRELTQNSWGLVIKKIV